MFLRNRAKQEQIKSASGGPPGAFATWQAAGGKSTPSHQPGALGRSWASRPSRCAVAARALTPIHSDSAPPSPCAALWALFERRAGQGVGAARSPAGARTRPLDATGATQACRQGVGGALPPAPLPLGERPPAGPPEALLGRAVQGGTPCRGSKGRAAPWA